MARVLVLAAMVVAVLAAAPAGAAATPSEPVRSTPAEWPLPVPSWFWPWARWYLDRGEYAGGTVRAESERPAAAPALIPDWGWRRLQALTGATPLERAAELVRDRARLLDGVSRMRVATTLRSRRDDGWALVAGSAEPVDRAVAAWVTQVRGRWVVYYLGVGGSSTRPQPAGPVPCDIRPAFAEPRCAAEPDDAPAAAVRRFVRAAAAGDADTLWRLLSPASRQALGPSSDEFERETLPRLRRSWGAWAGTGYDVVLQERVGPFAVVALGGRRDAAAAASATALDRIGGAWRLQLAGPVHVLGHFPTGRVELARPRVGASYRSERAPLEETLVWLDGSRLPVEVGGRGPQRRGASAQPRRALEPGRHVAVTLATTDRNAIARAWTFTVAG